MAGFNRDVVYADNVDFTGAQIATPQVTQNGQLLIGSAIAPNIRVGTLASNDGSVTITNGNGTIDLSVPGALTGIVTINGDSGSITGATVSITTGYSTNNSGKSVEIFNSGTSSVLYLTDVNQNTFLGRSTGVVLTTNVIYNVGVGTLVLTSLTNNVNSVYNSALGSSVLSSLTTGGSNTAMGHSVLDSLLTGTYNLALGYSAGSAYTSSETGNILLLNNGVVGDSHIIRIGTQGTSNGQQNTCYIAGINSQNSSGFTTPLPVYVDSSTGQLGYGSGGGLPWSVVSGTSQAVAVNTGYTSNNAGQVTFTLPATAAVGDTTVITGLGAGGWKIAQNAGQLIHLGSTVTTTGVGGSLASSNAFDSITITCVVANTTWVTRSSIGNITVV